MITTTNPLNAAVNGVAAAVALPVHHHRLQDDIKAKSVFALRSHAVEAVRDHLAEPVTSVFAPENAHSREITRNRPPPDATTDLKAL